jgi:dihydroorotate dehydrogenase (fumarate)
MAELDLTTRYLGMELATPLVASASPLSQDVATLQEMQRCGIGAVVMYSMFEEQIRRQELLDSQLHDQGAEVYGEAQSYFPDVEAPIETRSGPAYRYLKHVEAAVAGLQVPVIGSINGTSAGWWVEFARKIVEAGAAAIELNIYTVPGDLGVDGRDIEQRHLDILALVKAAVDVPVAVKLSPYFSSTGQMACRLDEAGADGLVLFNRFLQPEIDAETLRVSPAISLSEAAEARLPRTWIALLHGQVRADLAATSGVESYQDVVKYLLAGADVVMTASALLRHGPGYTRDLLDGLRVWLERKELTSVAQIRGRLAVGTRPDRSSYERASYVAALEAAKATYAPA